MYLIDSSPNHARAWRSLTRRRPTSRLTLHLRARLKVAKRAHTQWGRLTFRNCHRLPGYVRPNNATSKSRKEKPLVEKEWSAGNQRIQSWKRLWCTPCKPSFWPCLVPGVLCLAQEPQKPEEAKARRSSLCRSQFVGESFLIIRSHPQPS